MGPLVCAALDPAPMAKLTHTTASVISVALHFFDFMGPRSSLSTLRVRRCLPQAPESTPA
jgi:hypothetical protein